MSLLLTALLRGAALSGVGLVLLALLRRASAATRAAAATLVLGALFALPVGLFLAPRRMPPPNRVSLGRISVGRIVSERLTVGPTSDSTPSVPAPVSPIPMPSQPLPVGRIVVALWAVGASGLILRTLVGWGVALGWARRSSPLPEAARAGGTTIRVSDEIVVPCALWVGRSTILLPRSHADWDGARLRAVLLHETAHVRRGDWAALVLSRLATAVHWPNPLVWVLARTMRRAAEDAADDVVLRAGIAPADYADHLLALAPKRGGIALVLSMAARPDLARRIPLMLNSRRNHGSVSFATLALSGLLVGSLLGPLTSLVVGQRHPAGPIETSPYADIRQGKTTPGDPSNGFVGRFADGTTAQVVQVSMRTPQGIRAWTPSGALIPGARRRPVEHLGAHYRSILVRYPRRTTEADGGLGSGPRTGGEPSVLGFNSSRNQPGPTRTTWESYQFIEVPKEDGDRASFTFALSNESWRDYRLAAHRVGSFGKLVPAGRRRRSDDELRNVSVSREIAHPVRRDPQGAYLKDKAGAPLTGSAPATTLSFSPSGNESEYLFTLATAVLRDGRTVKPFWNDNVRHNGVFSTRYHFRQRPDEIRAYRIRARTYKNVEFHDVRLKPNAR